MKTTLTFFVKIVFMFILIQSYAFANFNITETWNADLRSQVQVECSPYTNICKELCGDLKICYLKNSTCKDCISTGVKMNYLFSAFGKEIMGSKETVSTYEFVDFLLKETFIAIGPSTIYNQFDSAQSDALVEKFKAMCPNKSSNPTTFFKIENKILVIKNARYITCGKTIYRLNVKSDLLE